MKILGVINVKSLIAIAIVGLVDNRQLFLPSVTFLVNFSGAQAKGRVLCTAVDSPAASAISSNSRMRINKFN